VLPIAAIDFDDAAAHYRNAKEFSVARTGRTMVALELSEIQRISADGCGRPSISGR
jgi:hypothetical protein